MKILVLFIDMLRPNLLHTWNLKNPDTRLDKWIRKMGGTIYLRAYTPGPDTPRSQACMWSSRYPKFNGCSTRIKYPMYNLYEPGNNFLRVFLNAGYQLNVYISNSTRLLGELPEDFKGSCNYSQGLLLQDYLNSLKIRSKSLTYLFFDDFHYAVDDYFAREQSLSFGIRQIMKCFETIERTIGFESFDYILIHSDHGFKKENEIMNTPFLQLGESRSGVFLMTKEKGEHTLTFDGQIRSVMDIGPALCEKAGLKIPYEVDGISLLSKKGHDYIVINDHKTFDVGINQTIEYWGIYTQKGFAAVDCDKNWEADYSVSEEQKRHFEKILIEHGDYFQENTLAAKIRHYYDDYFVSPSTYFDGERRRKHYSRKDWIRKCIRGAVKPAVPILKKLI